MKVSIIVVTYNSASTIIDTLESIKNQSFRDFELIIADDGSKDKTVSIIKEWIKENKDINSKLVESDKNYGLPHNCNNGLNASNGEYIKLLAGDDTLEKNAIMEYINFVNSHNDYEIAVSDLNVFGDDRNCNEVIEQIIKNNQRVMLEANRQYENLLRYNFITAPSVGLIKRHVLMEFGGYDENYPAFEDYPLNLKLSQNGYKYIFIPSKLVNYRISKNSITGKKNSFLFESEKKLFINYRFKRLIKKWKLVTALKQWIKFNYLERNN